MPTRAMTVLYVDDDPDLTRLVVRALGRRGYAMESAASADEALARVAQGGIDVMCLDHYLAGTTGLEVIAGMESATPPVVYVTASGEASVAVAALKAGAFDYVAKTVDEDFIELLGNAIDQAAEKSRLMRARDEAEREMREARERAEVLLHECNHRVANSLALVAALVRMQARAHADDTTRRALEGIEARIIAVGSVHRRLYTSDDVRKVDIGEYLTGLVQELESARHAAGPQARIRLDVDKMSVTTDKTVSIGVIVAELVTNALKYAYPSEAVGEIRVKLQDLGDGRVSLVVEDDGVGFDGSGSPKGTGIGSRIVSAMARGLGANLDYRCERGCRVALEFNV
jgi:two-component sensor histidine kinase